MNPTDLVPPAPPVRRIVRITKKSESQVFVQSFKEIKELISKRFRYKAANFFFHPLYRAKKWDGNIRLYNIQTNVFPAGLLSRLIEFLKEEECEVVIEPGALPTFQRHDLPEDEYFSEQTAVSLFESLNLPPEEFQLRSDQIAAVRHAILYEKCILLSPTSSGKSFMIYMIIRHMLSQLPEHKSKRKLIAIVVPNSNLVEQMYKDFRDYSKGTDEDVFSVDRDCHRIYSGYEKQTQAAVVISTWQSLANLMGDKEWFASFRVLIGDEAHTFKAETLLEMSNDCFSRAKMRVGTTGSLHAEKVHNLVVEGVFGPPMRTITTREMIDQNISSQLFIRCIHLHYPEEDRTHVERLIMSGEGSPYEAEMAFLAAHEKRQDFLLRLIRSLEGNNIVLFRKRVHGEAIFRALQANPGRKAFLVDGTTSVAKREKVREYAEKNDNVDIVASLGVFAQGWSVKNLQNGIFSIPFKSMIWSIQTLGRVLRKDGKDNIAYVYDIWDDLRTEEEVNFAYRHAMKRRKVYKSEQHEFEVKTVRLV